MRPSIASRRRPRPWPHIRRPGRRLGRVVWLRGGASKSRQRGQSAGERGMTITIRASKKGENRSARTWSAGMCCPNSRRRLVASEPKCWSRAWCGVSAPWLRTGRAAPGECACPPVYLVLTLARALRAGATRRPQVALAAGQRAVGRHRVQWQVLEPRRRQTNCSSRLVCGKGPGRQRADRQAEVRRRPPHRVRDRRAVSPDPTLDRCAQRATTDAVLVGRGQAVVWGCVLGVVCERARRFQRSVGGWLEAEAGAVRDGRPMVHATRCCSPESEKNMMTEGGIWCLVRGWRQGGRREREGREGGRQPS